VFLAGEHQVRWDGQDAAGHPVSSGVYVARLQGDGAVTGSVKLQLVR
jgi:flagellar hook assembly protein FlgD